MLPIRAAIAAAAIVFLAPGTSAAQEYVRHLRAPAGSEIEAVSEDGRYVHLLNGSVWEIEISDRAATGDWAVGDFVRIERISAPRNGYDWLLTKAGDGDQPAAVKLVGLGPES